MSDESELSDLLAVIADKEAQAMQASKERLNAQHDYLEAIGFTIDEDVNSFICGYAYQKDGKVFMDADHAMEYAQDS